MKYTKEQLELMLHSNAWPDRWAVARAGYGLEQLVNDEEPHVRYAVAQQGYGLEQLMHDSDESVRDMARSMFEKQKNCVDALISDATARVEGNKTQQKVSEMVK